MIFSNPVRGTISPTSAGTGFRMTQDFGPATLAAEPKLVWPGGEGIPAGTYLHFHRGIDIGNRGCGADLLAMAEGIVHLATKLASGEIVVVINHGGGTFTGYGHMASRSVSKGQRVTAGTKVGTIGATGNAFGCHLHAFLKLGATAASNIYSNSNGRWADLWRRLRQNVTAHPIPFDGSPVNIRDTAGAGTTPGPKFAQTAADGNIHRLADDVILGPTSQARKWLGTVPGATYSIDGVPGSKWESFELDGAARYVAAPLAVLSQK